MSIMSITPLEWYNHSLIQVHLHRKGLYIYINYAQSATAYTVLAVITKTKIKPQEKDNSNAVIKPQEKDTSNAVTKPQEKDHLNAIF